MRLAPLLALIALLPLAGCVGGEDKPQPTQVARLGDSPWWQVGESWDLDLTRKDGSRESFRLVHFWNDSESSHFWLGVADRAQALDMALHDDNPLLGRIHWGILTPHERGMHAQGLYAFPTQAGDAFGGLAFDREWTIRVREGSQERQLLFEGSSPDGATIAYDFLAANSWFSFIEIKDRDGKTELRVDVKEHAADAKGPHYFLRGRDYHEAKDPAGTHEETFQVEQEDVPHKSLAVEILGTLSGPLRIDFVDPTGAIRHSETLTGGNVQELDEIPTPAVGTWTIRYTGTGTLTGTVEAVGILEYTRTI